MHTLRQFLRQRWPELLIAGVWLQSIVSAAFTGRWDLLALASLGGLVLLVVIFWLVERLSRPKRPSREESEAFQVPRKGLVLLVGFQKDSLTYLIRNQKPLWIGLLCSRQTEQIADELAAESGLDPDHVQKEIADAWSVMDVREKAVALVNWLRRRGLSQADLVVDITGGTAIMSVGAFSVAEEQRIDTQYVRSEYQDNRPIPGTQRALFVSRFTALSAGEDAV